MSPRSFRAAYFVAAALIVAVGAAAYLTSFSGAFVLDDHEHIELNPRIRSLAPLSAVLAHSARPVAQLTLALNHAAGGLDPRGYHAVNLLIHLLAALMLFAILVAALVTEGRIRGGAPEPAHGRRSAAARSMR